MNSAKNHSTILESMVIRLMVMYLLNFTSHLSELFYACLKEQRSYLPDCSLTK